MQNHSTIITQCPNCDTQFKVAPGQLKVAAGQVRCGSCLVVFKATAHQLTTEQTQSQLSSPAPKPTTASKPETDQSANRSSNSPTAISQPPAQPDKKTTEKTAVINNTSSRLTDRPDAADLIKTVVETDVPTLTIETEPVLLARSDNNKPVSTRWLIASLLALLLIATQLLWFKRNQLYWDTHYQPLYNSICQLIDCDITLRSDITKIANRSINITPHTTTPNAISITLSIVNEAHFKQPFPALNIQFSDLKGRRVAARVFQPIDYLDLEIVDPKAMLSQQPYQISIEVMSPGVRGINYQVELLAPAL